MSHFKQQCIHGVTYNQCRCGDPNKEIRIIACPTPEAHEAEYIDTKEDAVFIELKDLHPGRCINYRNHRHSDGHVEVLRCLEYQAKPHVCSFPATTHVVSSGSSSWASGINPKPVPWVRPTDA